MMVTNGGIGAMVEGQVGRGMRDSLGRFRIMGGLSVSGLVVARLLGKPRELKGGSWRCGCLGG